MTDLGPRGTGSDAYSFPYTTLFRSSGQVIGNSVAYDANHNSKGNHAFLYANGQMTDLGAIGTDSNGDSKSFPDRTSTRLNSSHTVNSYAGSCIKKNAILYVNAKITD